MNLALLLLDCLPTTLSRYQKLLKSPGLTKKKRLGKSVSGIGRLALSAYLRIFPKQCN
jgi:hypothetical protein